MDRLLAALVLLLLAIVLVGGLTPYGAATSPDSIRYLDVADNIRAGNGIVYHNQETGPELVPFTTYPPLYPAALSLFLADGTRGEKSAARLAVLTCFLSAFLFFEILRPVGRVAAIAGSLIFMISQPMLTVFTYAWSESLAVPLLLLACWLALRLVDVAQSGRSRLVATWLASLTLCLGLLVWTRYISVLLTVILPLAWLLLARRRRWLPDFAAAVVALVAIVGALALRNHRLTGFVSGTVREPTTKSLADNLTDVMAAFDLQVSGHPVVLGAAVVLGVGLFVWKRWFSAAGNDQDVDPVHANRVAVIAAACPAVYFTGLVLLRSVKHFDDLDTRFISLGFPFVLLLLCTGLLRGWKSREGSVTGAASLGVCALLLLPVVGQGVAGYRAATAGWGLRGTPGFPLTYGMTYVNLNSPGWALKEEARLGLRDGRYLDVLIELHRSAGVCDDRYPIERAMATGYAGIGDVANSLKHTRTCLELDREQAELDVVEISKPFWDDPDLYLAGIEYYQALTQDLEDAWWLHQNIGSLAIRTGDRALAKEATERSQELKRSQTTGPQPGDEPE